MRKILILTAATVFSMCLSINVMAGTWKKDSNGWWYDYGNGSFPKSGWEWIDDDGDSYAESYYFNDKFMMSAGVALSGEKKSKSMANVGFTLKLGKGSGVTYDETPQYVVQNEVKRLTVENQELKERVRNLEEKLNMLLKNK